MGEECMGTLLTVPGVHVHVHHFFHHLSTHLMFLSLNCLPQVNMQQKVSGLELENKLLKREMSSLNDELGTVLERVREAEECMALHRTEAESLREQTAASERVIRQLRSHDEDIQAALEARDSQIQVSIQCTCRWLGHTQPHSGWMACVCRY